MRAGRGLRHRRREPARRGGAASTMPVAPAVSALRMTAPRFRGSVTPSSATRNARGSREQVVEVGGGDRRRDATTPCGASVRASRSIWSARHVPMRTPRSWASDSISSSSGASSCPPTAAARAPCAGRRRAARAPRAGPRPARRVVTPRRLEPASSGGLTRGDAGSASREPAGACGAAHRCQMVPLGVSSSTMPRASELVADRGRPRRSRARRGRRRARATSASISASSLAASSSCATSSPSAPQQLAHRRDQRRRASVRRRRRARCSRRAPPRRSPRARPACRSRRPSRRGTRSSVAASASTGRRRRRAAARRHERVEPLDRLRRVARAPSSPISICRR